MEEINSQEALQKKQEKNKHILKRYIQIVAMLLLLVVTFWYGFERGKQQQLISAPISIEKATFENKDKGNNDSIDFSLFWSAWNLLKEKYVDTESLDARKLFHGAIKGMLASTGDPYTTFFDPEENKKFSEDISGNFEGIGAELGVKNEVLTVIAPLAEMPAEKAGLRAGDKIIKIDGQITSDMSIEEAVSHIRGKKGTSVTLTIFRDGSQETQDIVIQRNIIEVKSVKLEFKENGIAYIEVSRFGDDTDKNFTEAINKVKNQKAKGLVIDLRNNPGGYLETSITMASKLLPSNRVVVIEESGDKSQKKLMTRGVSLADNIETVVLINEGSASASEILAGALKDNRPNSVTLVGEKSFGKGSVQEFVELPQGTAIKITVARWLTPNGQQINEQGIKPDVEVGLTNDDFNNDRDPQLEKAISILKDKVGNK